MTRWILRKTFTLDMAHHLPHYDGKCRNQHGHTYRITLEVSGRLQTHGVHRGMVMDLQYLGGVCEIIKERLDHTNLNEILKNPTCEMLGKYIFDKLRPSFKFTPGKLTSVTVSETPTTECRYEA